VSEKEDCLDLLVEHLTHVETTFGAIAEFMHDANEGATHDRGNDVVSVVTERGGLRVEAHDAVRPIASESLTAQNWNQRVALCIPETAGAMKPAAASNVSSCLRIGDKLAATKFVRNADADIADRYFVPGVGGIRRNIHEAHSGEIGVSVFKTAKDVVGEGVIDPGTDSPAVGTAAIGDERGRSKKGVGGRRIAPCPAASAEDQEAIISNAEPGAD